jgi:hypothetical protein
VRRQVGLDGDATLLRHAKLPAEERLGGGRSKGDEYFRLEDGKLGVEPGTASRCLGSIRLLMDAALAAPDPLEVLHRVRDVRERAVDTGCFESLVEDPPRRADERTAGEILLVPGLLAHEHDLGRRLSFAEHGLRPGLPEVARLAIGRIGAELIERPCLRLEQRVLGHPARVYPRQARLKRE